MSSELTPAAPLINLLAFVAIVGAMLAAARWLDRRIGRGDYTGFTLPGGAARSLLAEPSAPGVGWARPLLARSPALALDDRRALLPLLGAAVAVDTLFLELLPATIAPGELRALGTALRILSGQGPGPLGFDDAGQPALGGYLIALCWQLFGSGLAVERAIVGLLTAVAVVPLYALVRRVVAPLPAVLAVLLFVAAQPVLLAARGGWPGGLLLTTAAFGLWATVRAAEHRRARDWALWGLSLGLLCSCYPYGRLVAPALVVALPFALRGARLAGAWWSAHDGDLASAEQAVEPRDAPGGGPLRRETALRRLGLTAMLADAPAPLVRGLGLAALVCLLVLSPQFVAALPELGQVGAMPGVGAGALLGRVWQGLRAALLPGLAASLRADLAGGRWPDPLSLLLAAGGIVVAIRERRGVGPWWAFLAVPLGLLVLLGDDVARTGAALVAAVPLTIFVAIACDAILRRPALLTRTAQAATLGWIVVLAALNLGVFAASMASAKATAARQPALPAGEFWLWRDYQRSRLDLDEGLLGLREYRDLPSATIAARIAAQRDTTVEIATPQQRTTPRADLGTEIRAFGAAGTGPGQFGEVRAVAVDSAGNFYVADAGRAMIIEFDPAGAFVGEWPTSGQIAHPWSIASLPDNTLIVLDAETSRLARYDAVGGLLGTVQPLDQESIARGMALGGNGQLYIAQPAANRVVALPVGTLAGAAATIVAPAGAAGYQQPTSVVVNARGLIYLYEPDAKRLRGHTADGRVRFTRTAPATDTINAGGLALLPDGRVALADVTERTVLIYGGDGELLGSFPVAGLPQSLAVTPGGQVVVVDREGGKIRLYQVAAP